MKLFRIQKYKLYLKIYYVNPLSSFGFNWIKFLNTKDSKVTLRNTKEGMEI